MTTDDGDESETEKSLIPRIQTCWMRYTGVDWRTYQTIFKTALAPALAIAMLQADAVAKEFITVGYLVGIITILSIVPAPRAKFVQTMVANVFFSLVGFAVTYLAAFSVLRARSSLSEQQYSYDAAGSAVAGVWLFVQVWALNVVRAKTPQFAIPVIFWAIVANVTLAYAPQYSKMIEEDTLIFLLFKAFFTGFALASGVSLLIFPVNCRGIVFADIKSHLDGLRGALQANAEYLQSLETVDMFAIHDTKSGRSLEAEALESKMATLSALHAKLNGDVPFAKREIAVGKLGPDDIQECVRHLRMLMIPMAGLGAVPKIFEGVAKDRPWDRSRNLANADLNMKDARDEQEEKRVSSIQDWHHMMWLMRDPVANLTRLIIDGLEHVEIMLQLEKHKHGRSNRDIEADSVPPPGSPAFAAYYQVQANAFLKSKEIILRGWAEQHGIELPQDFFTNPDAGVNAPSWSKDGSIGTEHHMLRRQLFLFLHIEFLTMNVGKRTGGLIFAVDQLRQRRKLDRNRLIVPGFKRIRKYALAVLFSNERDHENNDLDGPSATVYLGEAFKKRRRPQHLAPANSFERFGDAIRTAGLFLKSPASKFGFRCAIATISVAIIDYCQDTQGFFISNRMFWAQVIISIGMSPASGAQSLRAFLLRILGTGLALLLSWVAWYIVDEQTAGVIVFMFLFLHMGAYVVVKYPQYFVAGMISQITIILVCGYELQARKIGLRIATSNAQQFFPIYILGPIRLATVSGGLFVAWIFTIIPYPNSERNQMRRNVASTLYMLANFYAVMNETVRLRLLEADSYESTASSSARRQLEKARNKLFVKCQSLISTLRMQSSFEKWDINLGGQFPRQTFANIIDHLQSMLNHTALVSLASLSIAEIRETHGPGRQKELDWLGSLRRLSKEANLTTQQITTLLSVLSSSISNEQPLPPHLTIPEPWLLSERLDKIDKDLLSLRHIAEPGYASFAVIQIGTRCVSDDLRMLMAGVKELVGELDFSLSVIDRV